MHINNLFNLKNKVCLITGGAGLIGANFSRVCAEQGAKVVIVDIDEEKGIEVVRNIIGHTGNSDVIFLKCDITSDKDIIKLISTTQKKFKSIDALVNNAYPRNKNYGRKFEEVTYTDFCENVNVHLGGYFLITKLVSEVMKKQKQGVIVNMASIYGVMAPKFEIYDGTEMTTPVEYSAIKGAVINLTKYLASYLGKYNIRVNAISPGGVANHQPESFVKAYVKKVVLGGRMAESDDITGVLVFLLSDASKYITGQNIVVDGGWSL